ncbi:helix-turn-helix domain-containing protein [Xylella fastidiosa]|uniref:helix-turn-helix domain-containing protein n=1 Tax=Xylella fastidiosa TaxID=2371 RepID=UPI000AC1FE16|nr:helix-turn-helix transcriptional regulator [Xylella fastidiosa]
MPTKNRDSYAIDVGRRLADARKAVYPPMSQPQAAKAVSKVLGKRVTKATISNYEQGIRLPKNLMVRALCRIYKTVSPAFVLGIEETLTTQEAELVKKIRLLGLGLDGVLETQQEANLIKEFRALDARAKRNVTSLTATESASAEFDRFKLKTPKKPNVK